MLFPAFKFASPSTLAHASCNTTEIAKKPPNEFPLMPVLVPVGLPSAPIPGVPVIVVVSSALLAAMVITCDFAEASIKMLPVFAVISPSVST